MRARPHAGLRSATRLSMLACLLLLPSCSSKSPTEVENDNEGPVPLGQRVLTRTGGDGQATVEFGGVDESYVVDITVDDYDSGTPVANLEVQGIALKGGIFLITHDEAGRYFPYTQYVDYEAFQEPEAPGSAGKRVPVVAIAFGVVAVYNIGVGLYEYLTDPPGLEEVMDDEGSTEMCIRGDLNDVLALVGIASGVSTLSGVVKVLGAPATVRGVTAIHSGFTRVNLATDVVGEGLIRVFETINGILDEDVQDWCWPVVDERPIPVFRVEVTRQPSSFQIERIISLQHYPIFASADAVETTLGVRWSGQPRFPVYLSAKAVVCYPGWTCPSDRSEYADHANPLVGQFGCVSFDPSSRSGYIAYQVQIEDADGLETPPVTFTFRCGGDEETDFSGRLARSAEGNLGTVNLRVHDGNRAVRRGHLVLLK